MGILSSLFGSKSNKIANDFFGLMIFIEDKSQPTLSYFECRKNFIPSGDLIEIGIDADISGPSQIQIDFFKTIESNYAEITRAIVPLIEVEVRNWNENFEIANFQEEFQPVYLKLSRCETKPIVWEIAFESSLDRNHTFTLTMNNFEAKDVLIDG